MAYFTDSNGNIVTEINKDNLEDFKLFIEGSHFEEREVYGGMSFNGIELEDIIGNYQYGLSEKAQQYLGRVIGSIESDDHEFVKKMAGDLLDNADKNPLLLRTAEALSGNRPAFGTREETSLYHQIQDQMKQRTLSQNLPALVAFAPSGFVHDLGEFVENPTAKDVQLFEQLYDLSQGKGTDRDGVYHCKEMFERIAARGDFANTKLSPQVRKAHNIAYLKNGWGKISVEDKILRMKKEFFDKDSVGMFIFSRLGVNADKHGRLPEVYKKQKEILMMLTEQTEKHDRNNYGKEKTFNQRYQEMMVDVYNAISNSHPVQAYKDIPHNYRNESVVRDMYLQTAQEDIKRGRAADLDRDALSLILSEDKKGYYFRMMPKDLIAKYQLRLNRRQEDLRSAETVKVEDNGLMAVVQSSNLSIKEKEETLARIDEEFSKERKVVKEEYEPALAIVKQEREEIKRLGDISREMYSANEVVKKVSALHSDILKNMKGKEDPSKEEKCLAPDQINALISDVMEGKNSGYVQMPDYGSLPLFGRTQERERREELSKAIAEFNKYLQGLPKEKSDALLQYASKGMLLPETVALAEKNAKKARDESNEANHNFVEKYNLGLYPKTHPEIVVESFHKKEESFQTAREHLQAHKDKIRRKAKDEVLPPEKSELQAVSKTADGDGKRAVRKANRQVVDKLEEKAKAKKGR